MKEATFINSIKQVVRAYYARRFQTISSLGTDNLQVSVEPWPKFALE